MNYRFVASIAATCIILSCKNRQEIKAKIFERKHIGNNRLLIKYNYRAGSDTYIDSATVSNTIINTDSINVIIDPSNPGKSLPDL